MKKKFLIIIIFFFNFSIKADDISNFQLEGVAIGESLLNHYDISKINKAFKNKITFPKSKKFYRIVFKSSSQKYDFLAYYLKMNDGNYIVYSLEGLKYINFNECKKNTKSISEYLDNLLGPNYKISNRETPHTADKTKKSIINETTFIDLKDETNWAANITCTNWSNKFEKKGYNDNLAIYLNSKEFSKFMHFEAY